MSLSTQLARSIGLGYIWGVFMDQNPDEMAVASIAATLASDFAFDLSYQIFSYSFMTVVCTTNQECREGFLNRDIDFLNDETSKMAFLGMTGLVLASTLVAGQIAGRMLHKNFSYCKFLLFRAAIGSLEYRKD